MPSILPMGPHGSQNTPSYLETGSSCLHGTISIGTPWRGSSGPGGEEAEWEGHRRLLALPNSKTSPASHISKSRKASFQRKVQLFTLC